MKNLVGPPVTGDNFYGREKELKDAMFLLEQGNSLLMASPRRVGKSSFAKKLTELCKNRNFKCIYLDLQGIADEQEFGDRIAESFRKIMKEESRLYGLIDNVGHFLNKVKKVDIKGVGLEFKDGAERFYNEVENLVDNVSKKRVLVVIDELAVFLQRIEEQSGISSVEAILNWLRKLRQKNQGHIVWVFCSSVSITNFASKNNLSYTINDLTPFRLGEMSYNEASGLLRLLCEGQNADPFSADETDVILRKIGWKLPLLFSVPLSSGNIGSINSSNSQYQ